MLTKRAPPDGKKMGKRIVRISGVLWQEMCTLGWSIGGSGYIIKCDAGLPEGARFCDAFYDPWSVGKEGVPMLTLIFEHPDWSELSPGERIPEIPVTWAKIRIDAWKKIGE